MIESLSLANQFLIEEFQSEKLFHNVEKNIDICFVDRSEKKRKEDEEKEKKENGKTNMAVDCQKQHEKIIVETFSF